jgi:CheY-like chemotaxis protein
MKPACARRWHASSNARHEVTTRQMERVVQLISEHRFDLVYSDIRMLDMSD